MNTVLVWVLMLHSINGGVTTYDNIANWDDCERLRKRTVAAATRSSDGYEYVSGSCTQINKIVITAPAPTVNVTSPEIKIPPAQVRVIIKDKK